MQGRSAIWGGATLGFIVGIVLGLLRGNFVNILITSVVIGAALGILAEILGMLGDRMKQ